MADTKPVETVPAAEPVVETKPEETAAAATEVAAPAAEAETAAPAAETEAPAAAAAADEPKEEPKPIEEGSLSHKAEGANFPKNLIHSKKLFWFGSEPVDLKAISSFKADKVADVAHHVTSWAAETGKGLLFFSEKDKAAPQGAIQLAEASEPVTDGSNKFHFTSKGHKHSFKAATPAERDAWVAQLKAKITEAKELATTVTESETYKKTIEALKPAKKEEKAPAAEAPAETAEATEAAAEPAAETPAAEAPKEEAKKEEPAAEEPKRRSASRKRASIFGTLLGKKDEKKVEAPAETKAAEPEAPAAETSAAAEAPAEAPATEAAATTEAPAEAKTEEAPEAPEAKPVPTKRTSIFSNFHIGKKKVASPEPTPATEEAPATTEAVAETAPVIPAVETTEPLSAEVTSPATAPTETTEVAPATNGETKKEVKSDKRKSSLPFVGAFLAKDKPTSGDEAEKPKSPSPFSKLRATIKGKKAEKAEEKTEAPAAEAEAAPAATEEAPKPAEVEAPAAEEPAKAVQSTPAVTAAA